MDPMLHILLENGTFKCDLCVDEVIQEKNRMIRHVNRCHLNHAVTYKPGCKDETVIPFCKKGCSQKGHHHCFKCKRVITRKDRIIGHIASCKSLIPSVANDAPTTDPQIPTSSTASSGVCDGGLDGPSACKIPKVERKVKCQHCPKEMFKRNIKIHMERQHSIFKNTISSKRFHEGICIDRCQGIYLVNSDISGGIQYPIHIQKCISGPGEQKLFCEAVCCEHRRYVAGMSGHASFECCHLQSVPFITSFSENIELLPEVLDFLINAQRLKEESKSSCLSLKRQAESMRHTFVAAWVQETKTFVSIWVGEVHNYSKFERVVVTFDAVTFDLTCWCTHSTKIGCIHKSICKWYLATTVPEVFNGPWTGPENLILTAGLTHSAMTDYLLQKKIPYEIPNSCLAETSSETILYPVEEVCPACQTKLDSVLIHKNRQVYSRFGVMENITVWVKQCDHCKLEYWYNDQSKGLFNYNNRIFVTFDLLMWLKNALYEHTAIGREISTLNWRYKANMDADKVRKAFFKLISLMDLDGLYKCCLCGYHPTILTFDVIRKCVFSMPQLQQIDRKSANDAVDSEKFWTAVNALCIEDSICGLSSSKVDPSPLFWAPWIPRESRRDCMVFNTEYLKGNSDSSENEFLQCLSEERLEELFNMGDVKTLREMCKNCGIKAATMSKIDCITRLKSAVESVADIDKMFFKVWQGSGGTLTATCPHGIVYALKFLLKAESPRDVADILLSLKHPPNVVISDIPHLVAAMVNKRCANFFAPYAGRVDNPSELNIENVKNGMFCQKSFPWLNRRHQVATPDVKVDGTQIHPITCVQQRLSLYDKFHQGNSKLPAEVMRRTALIKELNGVVTETAEQVNNFLAKNTYFLDSMTPIHHVQMIRMLIAERNNRKNEKVKKDIEQLNAYGKLVTDIHGRLVIQSPLLDLSTPTLPNPVPPPASSPSSVDVSTNGFVPCRNTWASPIVFDPVCSSTPDNAPFTLGEEDMATLRPEQYVVGQVIDALFLIFSSELFKDGIKTVVLPECFLTRIHQDASMEVFVPDCEGIDFLVAASFFSHHWSLILIDIPNKLIFYIDPKETYIPHMKVNEDIAVLKKIVWYNILGNERHSHVPNELHGWKVIQHRNFSKVFHCHLPKQNNSYDCGVFVVMYFFYITRQAIFDFSTADMFVIRKWLFSILLGPYEDMSPYMWWLLPKMEPGKLGSLTLCDVSCSGQLQSIMHVKRWLEEYGHLFSRIPRDPPVLEYPAEEQIAILSNLDQNDVEADHLLSFTFYTHDDFRLFMDYVNKMKWSINVECVDNYS